VGCLQGSEVYFGIRAETSGPMQFSYGRFVLWQIGCWLLWAILTPFVVWLSRRVPLAKRPGPIAIHVAVSALIPFVRVGGIEVVSLVVKPWGASPGNRSFLSQYFGTLSSYYHLDLLVYWAIVGVVHAVDSRQRLREREVHASRVEAQLAQSQLANLRLQLQPHFLFNTLHSIAALVRDGDSPGAVAMIAGLSDLLRYSLDNARRNVVPLSEEIDVVTRYLEIQQTRFSDRLRVTIDISEETRNAAVPTLLLQPLIENAIRHGIAALTDAGVLTLTTRREEPHLIIEVFDDGPPLPANWNEREGVGLSATRARLQQLYGAGARLELVNRKPAGVIARVTLPFSRELVDV
jgi:LytS/YehU family sensor histidine kinase